MVLSHLWSKISANYCFRVSFESLLIGRSLYSLRNNNSGKNIFIQFPRTENNDQTNCLRFFCSFLPSAECSFPWVQSVPDTISQSQRLCCTKSHTIWGTSFCCLKACQIWQKSCWQSVPGRCIRYDFLAAIPSCCVAVWLWRQEQEGPECGNQLCPQVCQSGVLSRQTLWKHGLRIPHLSVNNLKNKMFEKLKAWTNQKASFSEQSHVHPVQLSCF